MVYKGKSIYKNGSYIQLNQLEEANPEAKNIYEVIRIIHGKVLFWKEHLDRLENSLRKEKVDVNLDEFDLPVIIKKVLLQNNETDCNMRIDFFAGQDINLVIGCVPSFYPGKEMYRSGVHVKSLKAERKNPAVKIVQNSLKKRVAEELNDVSVFEVLLINKSGYITEGSKTNVFLIKDATVFTSKPKNVLNGITRKNIVKLCHDENIKLVEKDIELTELQCFEACFLTGTSPKVLPVKSVDGITFSTNSTLMKKIMIAYNHLIDRSLYTM